VIDGLELAALAVEFVVLFAEATCSDAFFVDIEGSAEPLLDLTGGVADGRGAEMPPAGGAVAGAEEAGIDSVVIARGDAVGPDAEDPLAIAFVEACEIFAAFARDEVATNVIEEALIGVEDAAFGIGGPERLRTKFGEDAVALFAAAECVFAKLLPGDVTIVESDTAVDGKGANMEPYLEGGVEEGFEDTLDAVSHYVAVGFFNRRTESLGVEFPVCLCVEVLRAGATDFACGTVGIEDAPLGVENENAVGKVLNEWSKRRHRGG
jgi:hypothetical protein